MSYKPPSRREYQATKKELQRLRDIIAQQNRAWSWEWPGEQILRMECTDVTKFVVNTARKLGHGVVCTADGNTLVLWARKLEQ